MFKRSAVELALMTSAYAFAADPVTDTMQKAYAPYRAALFKTNSNSQTESQQAVTQAQQAWDQLIAQFGARPAAPYDRDPAFAASLAAVSKVCAKAAAEISRNKLGEAHETLEEARDIIAELRRRNQVIGYSDHMNAYHAEMERVLIDGPQTLAEPQGMLKLTAQTGTLAFLAKRLSSEAPAEYAKNEEFIGLVKALEKSVADLNSALLAQDAAAFEVDLDRLYRELGLNQRQVPADTPSKAIRGLLGVSETEFDTQKVRDAVARLRAD